MHETFISDSEDEGGEDPTVYDNFNYNYMMDEMKHISDDQHHMNADTFGADDRTDHHTYENGECFFDVIILFFYCKIFLLIKDDEETDRIVCEHT